VQSEERNAVKKPDKQREPTGVTAPHALIQSERHRKVIEMARAGYSWVRIAEECGYKSSSGPFNVVKRWLDRYIGKPIEEYRAQQLDRLQRATQALWGPAVQGKANGKSLELEQQLRAMDRLLRCVELQGRLAGCMQKEDGATGPQVDIHVSSTGSSEVEVHIRELREQGPEAIIAEYQRIAREVIDVTDESEEACDA